MSPMSPAYWEQSKHPLEPPAEPSARRKIYRATPAVTRSRAAEVLRSGVANTGLPGAFAPMAAEEEMLQETATSHVPDLLPPDKLVTEMPTPETDAEADSSPYRKHHARAREKEMAGHFAAGTFVELSLIHI